MDIFAETATTAAPVLDGQAVSTPSTADRLAAARTAHAGAVDLHRQARDRADRASALHQQAIIEKQQLINEAAAGRSVDQIEIARAKIAVNEAADAADHCKLVATGAETLANREHIIALQAEANHLTARHAEAVASLSAHRNGAGFAPQN